MYVSRCIDVYIDVCINNELIVPYFPLFVYNYRVVTKHLYNLGGLAFGHPELFFDNSFSNL